MASCIQSMLFIGFVGSLVPMMLSIYEWNKTQEIKAEGLDQELRQKLLRDTCDANEEAYAGGKHRFEDMTNDDLNNFIVDDKHGIIYCIVPKVLQWKSCSREATSVRLSNWNVGMYPEAKSKVACTNWKRILFVLNQSEPYDDLLSIPGPPIHYQNMHIHLDTLPRAEIMAKLKHYTKFLFVRNPFARLISAYRDKFMKHNEHFYQSYARDILRLYGNQSDPPKSADEAFASGVRPSFENFIRFLVEKEMQPFEPHWRQVTRLCHPCLIQYDFIGHYETLEEDADKLLNMLNLEDKIKFPRSDENTTSSNFELDWYRTVPLEVKRKLYKLYEWDFRLFGYQCPGDLFHS